MKPLKLCLLLSDKSGGIRRYVENLTSVLVKSEIDLTVVGPEVLQLDPKIKRVHFLATSNIWGVNQWRFAIFARLYKTGRHVVRHTHNMYFGKSDIHTVHGFYHKNWVIKFKGSATLKQRIQFALLSKLEKASLNNCRKLIFVSKENQDYALSVLKVSHPHSLVINSGVDTEKFFSISDADEKIRLRKQFAQNNLLTQRWGIFVGSDFEAKGLFRFLEKLDNEPFTLLIFGNDQVLDHQKKLKDFELKLTKIKMIPYPFSTVDEMALAYRVCDFLLMDSVSEGFSLVLLEALASGCIPLVTPFEGVNEVIKNGVNGIVSKNVLDLTKSIFNLSDLKREEMSKEARKSALNMTWQNVAQQYEEIYRELE